MLMKAKIPKQIDMESYELGGGVALAYHSLDMVCGNIDSLIKDMKNQRRLGLTAIKLSLAVQLYIDLKELDDTRPELMKHYDYETTFHIMQKRLTKAYNKDLNVKQALDNMIETYNPITRLVQYTPEKG